MTKPRFSKAVAYWPDIGVAENEVSPTLPAVLVIESDSDPVDIASFATQFEQVVVVSREFTDGRIFSLGKQLRNAGFAGRLSVTGDIIPDQYDALQSCGFDQILRAANPVNGAVIDLNQATDLMPANAKATG
jgi:uncharacterized protein (DUF934 family)